MSIEFLVTFTYSAATLFMMLLVWGIGLVTVLRRNRFGNIDFTVRTRPQAISADFSYRPLDEWREWNKLRRDNTSRVESTVVMPMRYQQPLFFGDPLSENTKQNPAIETNIIQAT
jgi:hypothetical protein